jgi:hypothetical protein
MVYNGIVYSSNNNNSNNANPHRSEALGGSIHMIQLDYKRDVFLTISMIA